MKDIIRRILSCKLFRKITRLWAYPYMCKLVDADLRSLDTERLCLSVPVTEANVLYLRTDFWLYGKASNGAMAHTIGVVDALKHLCLHIDVHTIAEITYLKDDIHQIIHRPSGFLAQLGEIGEAEYSHHLAREIYEQVKDTPLSFVYQRYGRNNYTGVLLAQWLHIPCVMEYNGSEIWMANNWMHKLRYAQLTERIELAVFKAADLIIGNAEALKCELVNRGIDENKILIIPNGVDPKRFNPQIDGSVVRKDLGFLGDNIVVTFVGSFGPWHGTEVLARAIKDVIDVNNKIRFLFVGSGGKLQEVMNIVKESGMQEYVTFTGQIQQNLTPHFLAASDILVSPTIPNPDGTPFFGSPTKLFEYMAMGKPIISSNLGQMSQLLTNEETAILIEPGNPKAIADAILKIVSNPSLANKIGTNALKLVLDKYTWEEHVRLILAALK